MVHRSRTHRNEISINQRLKDRAGSPRAASSCNSQIEPTAFLARTLLPRPMLIVQPCDHAACQAASRCRSLLRTASAGSARWLWDCPHRGLRTFSTASLELKFRDTASLSELPNTTVPLCQKGGKVRSLTWINEGKNKFATSHPRLAGISAKDLVPSCSEQSAAWDVNSAKLCLFGHGPLAEKLVEAPVSQALHSWNPGD